MIALVDMLGIFQGTTRSLKRWQMHGCLMNLFSAGMLTLIGWNQGRFAINQCEIIASPMVSGRVNQDTIKEDAAGEVLTVLNAHI